MAYKNKDLISTKELTKEEIIYFLDTAKEFKELNNSNFKKADYLKGKTVVNAFYENSTRTKVSFEIAAKRLGADAINFTESNSSSKKGETLIDTIKNMETMKTDIFVLRHPNSGSALFVAKNSNASIINAGDGANEHPTQTLLDLLTIREFKGDFKNLTVAIIGDIFHSRVARSNIYAMKTLGINVKLFGNPMMFSNHLDIFECTICKNIEEAIEGSDVLIMLRVQLERQDGQPSFPSVREYSRYFGLTASKMKYAKKDVLVMHPGPINRGVELDSEVADNPNVSVILDQVESGAAIRMAILKILNENRNR
jgi:aspartate carbamoyltransferase catalytic subunit